MFAIGTQCTFGFQLGSTFIMQSHLTPTAMSTGNAVVGFDRFLTSIASKQKECPRCHTLAFTYRPAQLPSFQ
jgi:hypothetical protein